MISTKNITSLGNCLASGATPEEISQLSAVNIALKNSIYCVENCSGLPSTVLNKGRLVYDAGNSEFLFSNGFNWSNDFSSTSGAIVGDIFTVGANFDGGLGIGCTSDCSLSPVSVVSSIKDWCYVSGSKFGSRFFAMTKDKCDILYGWGSNQYFALGNGDDTNRCSPSTVITPAGVCWTDIQAGLQSTLGLTTTGALYGWGANLTYQLGSTLPLNTCACSPVTVGGTTSLTWCSVSLFSSHALAIDSTGAAYAWGSGGAGRLGTGNTTNRCSPVLVSGGITNWCQVSTGDSHSLGLTSTGCMYAWGCNAGGRLGDNSITNRCAPIAVAGNISNWCQISAGYLHSMAITSCGILYSWGCNIFGELGNCCTSAMSSPATVVGGITNWSKVVAGCYKTMGITAEGSIYGWGFNITNSGGSIGVGDCSSNRCSPTREISCGTWTDVSASRNNTAMLKFASKGL
jgi:alpha-tubulin suppressor-like RCC1 family protein